MFLVSPRKMDPTPALAVATGSAFLCRSCILLFTTFNELKEIVNNSSVSIWDDNVINH